MGYAIALRGGHLPAYLLEPAQLIPDHGMHLPESQGRRLSMRQSVLYGLQPAMYEPLMAMEWRGGS